MQLDLIRAYYQILIQKGNKQKTEFRIRYSHFKYQGIIFGLSSISTSFQGYINKILSKKFNVFIIVYMDEVLIYTKDECLSHVKVIQWIFEKLWKYSLYDNLKKCCFYQNEIQFLGYIVSLQSICKENDRIIVVYNWPKLQSVQDIQVIL